MRKLILVLSIAALAVSCGKPTLEDIKSTKWQLTELPGKQFDYQAIKGDNYKIEFTSNAMGGVRIEGVGDCSPFRIETTVYPELESIRCSTVKLKRGQCNSVEQEIMFTNTIKEADFYKIDGQTMELYDGRLLTMKLKRIN